MLHKNELYLLKIFRVRCSTKMNYSSLKSLTGYNMQISENKKFWFPLSTSFAINFLPTIVILALF